MMCSRRGRIILAVLLLYSVQDVHITDAQENTNTAIIQMEASSQYRTPYHESHSSSRNISVQGNNFVLDGQVLHIVSGSLHYFRVPAEYWRDRLQKFKAGGLNAVCLYVEWSYHEPEERQYNFEADRDVAKFIQMAAEVGLYVLLRPGPYICAERDLGGLPYWLLSKYPGIKLRSTDADFMEESKIWFTKLFGYLTPYLYGNGGPIILVQVENEYGSYDRDMAYKTQLRDILLEHVGTNALLYTTDGSYKSYFTAGAIPGTITTIDFGPTDNSVHDIYRPLREFMPEGPLMNSEYYTGWLTHWRERMASTPAYKVVDTMRDMLRNNVNINFYMFFGGTNFEFSAGANYGGSYQPDITSYDYDAPLSEAGDPTDKYYAIRDVLKQYNFVDENIQVPTVSSKGAYGMITLSMKYHLMSSVGRSTLGKRHKDVAGWHLPTFEHLRQRGGLVLYETKVTEGGSLLHIQMPRDMVFVYVDGVYQGVISRMFKIFSLPVTLNNGSVLSLLVENQGRINFGPYIHDFKGILSPVEVDNKTLNGRWVITGYPLEAVDSSPVSPTNKSGARIYDAYFTLEEGQEPLDTFLDTTGWGKGYVWVNGHNLGRYWPGIGPQVTLYVPGVWLNSAPVPNHVQILELQNAASNRTIKLIDHPILDGTGTVKYW